MEDDSDQLAFRRVVASVAARISKEDVRKLTYLHLYQQRETLFRDADALEVLAALESAGAFSPARPECLLEILERDLKNRQLANLVKVFMRNKKRKSVIAVQDGGIDAPEPEDSRVQLYYRLAVGRTNVLVKHLEALRLAAGGRRGNVDEAAAMTALENICEAAAALAGLREKASRDMMKEPPAISKKEKAQPDKMDMFTNCCIDKASSLSTSPPQASNLQRQQQNPVALKHKPALKPKPKLKAVHVTEHWTAPSNSLPESGFDSCRSSSVPHLIDNDDNTSTENGETRDYEEYISTEVDEEEILDRGHGSGRGGKEKLMKTKSLPYLISSDKLSSHHSSTLTRPLPALPKRLLSEGHGQVGYQMGQGLDDSSDYSDNDGPVYDKILDKTLLSRTGRPVRLDSSSSSD